MNDEGKRSNESSEDEDRQDTETMNLNSLLRLPEFEESNLPGLPFACPSFIRVGICEDFLRIGTHEGADWGPKRRSLIHRADCLGYLDYPICFANSVEFVIPDGSGKGTVTLRIDSSAGRKTLYLDEGTSVTGRSYVEVWEKGELLSKTTISEPRNRLLAEIQSGVSLFLRTGGGQEGIEILVSDTELSVRDWKGAMLYLILAGSLMEGVRILKEKILPLTESPRPAEWFGAFLESVLQTAKSTSTGLVPMPLFRGESSGPQHAALSERFPIIGQGIERCWPEGARLEKCGSTAVEELIRTYQSGEFPREVPEFVLESGVSDLPDSQWIANAWCALVGWISLEKRDYEKAALTFSRIPPAQEDPFGLQAGKILAEHLKTRANVGEAFPPFETNDMLWAATLGNILGSYPPSTQRSVT